MSHIVFVHPETQRARAWLTKYFDQLSVAFQGVHRDEHKLSLQTKFVPGVVLYESPDAFPRIRLLIGDEAHARQTSRRFVDQSKGAGET